ncbi:MAG: UMP kinase [Bacteroidales bacterium]|nr:UMP kinase [Bacteroidales bacterium]
MIKYKRILLKLSGESLLGNEGYGIDSKRLNEYSEQIKELVGAGTEVGIVIGGGNIFRGLSGVTSGFDRVKGDQMGMLATVINSLALQSSLSNLKVKSVVFTAVRMEPVGELFNRDKAVDYMTAGKVVILSGGTGNPFFTTDTASALRAVEIGAEIILKGTRVDGVYSADPEKDPEATRFNQISFDEVIKRELNVMDLTAFTMCKENNLPIYVFDMNKKGNLLKVINGENIGTLIGK